MIGIGLLHIGFVEGRLSDKRFTFALVMEELYFLMSHHIYYICYYFRFEPSFPSFPYLGRECGFGETDVFRPCRKNTCRSKTLDGLKRPLYNIHIWYFILWDPGYQTLYILTREYRLYFATSIPYINNLDRESTRLHCGDRVRYSDQTHI